MNDRAFKKRFSDTLLFWAAYSAVLISLHVFFYLKIAEVAPGLPQALWAVWSLFMLSSQFVARRTKSISGDAPKKWTDRAGALWAFVVVTAFIFFAALEVVRVFSGISLSVRISLLLSFAAAMLVAALGVKQVNTVRVVTMEVPTDKLPEGAGRLRVVQLTDLHLGPFTGVPLLAQILRKVRAASPDIVVVTGDLADGDLSDRRRELAMLRRIRSRFGVYAVPGNHDYYDNIDAAVAFMESAGMRVLRTEAVRAGGIIIAGADDKDHMIKEDWNLTRSEAMVLSLAREQKKTFLLLLRHRPIVEYGTVGNFDLQLSGHTHGGQLLPSPTSRHVLAGYPRGLKKIKSGGFLYVSNGAGFVGPPVRLMAPPEIAVFDIVRKKYEASNK